MKRIHTHYDNLKVSRNASYRDIRSAYRKLALRHHPDKNRGDPNSLRVMQIINASYAVLSDDTQRALYDKWIADQERANVKAERTYSPPNSDSSTDSAASNSSARTSPTETAPKPTDQYSSSKSRPYTKPSPEKRSNGGLIWALCLGGLLIIISSLSGKKPQAVPLAPTEYTPPPAQIYSPPTVNTSSVPAIQYTPPIVSPEKAITYHIQKEKFNFREPPPKPEPLPAIMPVTPKLKNNGMYFWINSRTKSVEHIPQEQIEKWASQGMAMESLSLMEAGEPGVWKSAKEFGFITNRDNHN